jgi:hypothetical protein
MFKPSNKGPTMKKISLAVAGIGLLALAACDRGKQEQLGDDVELNAVEQAEDLNALSDQAAVVAAEAGELQNQANQIEQDAEAIEDASGPETPEDENIQGM